MKKKTLISNRGRIYLFISFSLIIGMGTYFIVDYYSYGSLSKGLLFNAFEYSDIRDYSYSVTTSNSKLEMIEHSGNNFHIYNIECIYSWVKTYPDGFLDIIKVKDWEYLADDIVNSWIASPPHEIGISSDQFTKATITTILTIDSNADNYRLDASYHGKY